MLLLEMAMKNNTTASPVWSLFPLFYLLLLPLLVLFSRCLVMSLECKIRQKLGLLSKWLLREKANKRSGLLVQSGLLLWPDLHGMDNHEIKVLEFLEHSTCSLLGVYGIRGVGKTTLLWLVRNTYAAHNDDSFDYIFYARASNGCTMRSLQDVLAANIGLGLPLHTSNMAIAEIISSFLRDKTFLLLLDDVCERIDLAAIGLPVPLGHRQKVIFTTRNQSICTEMGCESNTIQMQCLGDDVAWDLFRYNVGDEIIKADSEIEELAKMMVVECRGFPSALCTIGRTMSLRRDVKHWRVAYDVLTKKCPLPNETHDMSDQVYSCLQFFEDEF